MKQFFSFTLKTEMLHKTLAFLCIVSHFFQATKKQTSAKPIIIFIMFSIKLLFYTQRQKADTEAEVSTTDIFPVTWKEFLNSTTVTVDRI